MKGVREFAIEQHKDSRGILIAFDRDQNLPFPLQRVFFIYPENEAVTRGAHALSSQLLLLPLLGAVTVTCKSEHATQQWRLAQPTAALHIDAGIWLQLSSFTQDCIVAVASPHLYADIDYYDRALQIPAIDAALK